MYPPKLNKPRLRRFVLFFELVGRVVNLLFPPPLPSLFNFLVLFLHEEELLWFPN